MTRTANGTPVFISTPGVLTYLDETVPGSLFRTGRMRTTRCPAGSDAPLIGVSMDEIEVTIHIALAALSMIPAHCPVPLIA